MVSEASTTEQRPTVDKQQGTPEQKGERGNTASTQSAEEQPRTVRKQQGTPEQSGERGNTASTQRAKEQAVIVWKHQGPPEQESERGNTATTQVQKTKPQQASSYNRARYTQLQAIGADRVKIYTTLGKNTPANTNQAEKNRSGEEIPDLGEGSRDQGDGSTRSKQ